jgi:hypothetical protein
MKIVTEGPSRDELLAALATASSVRFGPENGGAHLKVLQFCAVGDRGQFIIDVPRAANGTALSACIVSGRIDSGSYEGVVAAAYVTFDDPVEPDADQEVADTTPPGTFKCAVLVRKFGATEKAELDFAAVLTDLLADAAKSWVGFSTASER